MSQPKADIEGLRNLGATSAAWLRSVGILTQRQLRDFGAVVAFKIVRDKNPKASLNLLWAMAAGLEGRDWRELSALEKESLRVELKRLTQADDV